MDKMSGANPWREFPHDIYEKHMGHEKVQQLQTLSRITGDQFALVANIRRPTVALLGITDGNGLCNIPAGCCETIIGMDINEEYLNICRERHSAMSELVLHSIDLMAEKDRAVELLKPADIVIANMVVEHIHLDNFVEIVCKLTKPIVSVTIQFNPDGYTVSHSGYEAAFDDILQHGQNCDEVLLIAAMRNAGYEAADKKEYVLPNEKVFVRLDFK
ncbi:MAG: class I SAM-dependent methyltransferase [Methanomassiliicoccaceae archaeon]|nr:class I SAM-dependent methyltransferase [Methanomassiliicoccaceae archaeon]